MHCTNPVSTPASAVRIWSHLADALDGPSQHLGSQKLCSQKVEQKSTFGSPPEIHGIDELDSLLFLPNHVEGRNFSGKQEPNECALVDGYG